MFDAIALKNSLIALLCSLSELGGSLLQQIRCLRVEGEAESSPSIELFTEKGSKPRKAGFIEVLSSTELEPAPVQTPSYHLSVSKDENGRATTIQLNVHLPEVSSVSECDLAISQVTSLVILLNNRAHLMHAGELFICTVYWLPLVTLSIIVLNPEVFSFVIITNL